MAKNSDRKPRHIVTESRVFRGRMCEAGTEFDARGLACSDVEVAEWAKKGYLTTAEELAKSVQVTSDPPAVVDE
jgi:hypothetical protein